MKMNFKKYIRMIICSVLILQIFLVTTSVKADADYNTGYDTDYSASSDTDYNAESGTDYNEESDRDSATPYKVDYSAIFGKDPNMDMDMRIAGYYINDYDIDIKVGEDNVYSITETINVYFNQPKHGIYRTIPMLFNYNDNGTLIKKYLRLSDVSVDNKYKLYTESSDYYIQIGNPDSTVTGEQKYVLKYKYNLGKDEIKNKDLNYFNIVGGQWVCPLKNVDYKITFPKNIDPSNVEMYLGTNSDSKTLEKWQYKATERSVSGTITNMPKFTALTIKTELPEGYFSKASDSSSPINYLFCLIPILVIIIAIVIWYLFGKDDKVIETVEFAPPGNFNSAEVGYVYKGYASNKDVISLLIYLAGKGYIEIIGYEKNSSFAKNRYTFRKLKEYDGDDENEAKFLEGLFKKKQTTRFGENVDGEPCDEVEEKDLTNRFYKTINQIKKKLDNKEDRDLLFDKSTSGKTGIMFALYALVYFALPIILLKYEGMSLMYLPSMAFVFIFGLVGIIMVNRSNLFIGIFMTIFITLVYILMIFFFLNKLLLIKNEVPFAILTVLTIIAMIVLCVLRFLMPKRTSMGNELLGKVRGFKTFLETAEKDKLEMLVETNPEYCYEILPYAYVLGVSGKWMEKFESLGLEPPNWYHGPRGMNNSSFNDFMNSGMSSVASSMSSSPNSSGSSGGGSAGGGAGGGGGGAW